MWTNDEKSIIRGILDHGIEIVDHCVLDSKILDRYLERLEKEKLDYPRPKNSIDPLNWFIPDEYKKLDIERFLVDQCPEENYQRLIEEINLYKKYGMISVLKTMKYIVDTLRSNKITWGVGRGSSVASYALFLIGVHKIDPIKYNIPITEFFK